MQDEFTDAELLAYLDESLSIEGLAAVEQAVRSSSALGERLVALSRGHDGGIHSVGEIWRRGRLSCPTRHQLGSFLLEALDPAFAEYIEFHLRTVGCRYCAANLDDLKQALASNPQVQQRRRKFFESSAGLLDYRV